MSHTIIDLPSVRDDGRLYRDTALNFVESLIPNPWNSCHAPDLLELENGDLLCCWFAGSCEGNADVSIAVSRLSEDSSQWETPVIVSDDPTRSEQNPSLFLHPNGEIWLMYTAQVSRDPNNPTSDNLQGTAEIRRKISRDNGHTWEATARPVIASDINGCREIFENGVSGLAFLPQNADSLTETIERFLLLAPEERAEMGRQARAYVEAHFDRRQVVTAYLETLGSLIGATRC